MTYLEPFVKSNTNLNQANDQHFLLTPREAEAASPDDMAVCGEEDPGEGLEFLVAGDTEN